MTAHHDLGFPEDWADIVDSLSEAPSSTWSAPPFAVVPALQRLLDALTERDRIVLTLRAGGESPADVANLLGIGQARVREIERRATSAVLRTPSRFWDDLSEWMRQHGLGSSVIVRPGRAELRVGTWGTVDEGAAWSTVCRILRSRGGHLDVFALEDGRLAIIDRWRHRSHAVERWLRGFRRFATPRLIEEATGVPATLIARAASAFGGLRLTRCGLCYSIHLSQADLAKAAAEVLAAMGIDEWHPRQLGALMRHLLPKRLSGLTAKNVETLVSRPDMDAFEPIHGTGRWRYVGPMAPHLRPVSQAETGHRGRGDDGIGGDASTAEPETPLDHASIDGDQARSVARSDSEVPGPSKQDPRSAGANPAATKLAAAIVEALRQAKGPMTIHEIAVSLGISRRPVHRALFDDLIPNGTVTSTDGRRWAAVPADDDGTR